MKSDRQAQSRLCKYPEQVLLSIRKVKAYFLENRCVHLKIKRNP